MTELCAKPLSLEDESQKQSKEEKERRLRLIVFRTIVQLSETVDANFFLEKLNYLDTNSWSEVIEERYLGRLCGIPSCANSITVRRSQKYRIDRKNKKVYERCTEREKFCSEKCFFQSANIQLQLHEEPLWMRGITQKVFSLARNGRILPEISEKKFVLDDSHVKPHSSKESAPEFEIVQERIQGRLTNLIVGDSAETDDEDAESEGELERKKDDDLFVSEISNFLLEKPQSSGVATLPAESKTILPAVSVSCSAADVVLSSALHPNELRPQAVHAIPGQILASSIDSTKSDSKEISAAEKLAKIRDKLSMKNAKRSPIIVEAKPLDRFVRKKIDEFEVENFRTFIKQYISEEALDYIRRRRAADILNAGEVIITEAEKLIQQFYAGDKTIGRTDDSINLPRVDAWDQKVLRNDVFARLLKPSWRLLENDLKANGLYEKVQPLVTHLNLSATNVDLQKSEARLFAALLLKLLAHCDEVVGDEFFPEGRACSPFQDFVERSGCKFTIFEAATLELLKDV